MFIFSVYIIGFVVLAVSVNRDGTKLVLMAEIV